MINYLSYPLICSHTVLCSILSWSRVKIKSCVLEREKENRTMSAVLVRIVKAISLKLAQYYYSSLASAYLLWRWMRTGGNALKLKERQMPRLDINYSIGYKWLYLTYFVRMTATKKNKIIFRLLVSRFSFKFYVVV